VFTEESSPQSTPLGEERLPFSDPNLSGELQPTPSATSLALPSPWWGAVKAGTVWLSSVIILLFVPLILALPYAIYRITAGGPVSQEALVKDPTLILLSVVGILPAHVLTFAVGWMFVTGGGKYPFWKTIGFEWPQNTSPLIGNLLSLLAALILLAVAWAATTLYGGGKTDLDLLIESSLPARFVLAFAAVATAPLVEEVIYRGVLYTALERATGKIIAVFAVSFLFAGVHVWQYWNNIAVIIVITVLSFTLTACRAVTGKVLPSFIIHLIFNGIQSILIVLGAFIDNDALK
jgi:membrane protease YdiL (CAAX protease family)